MLTLAVLLMELTYVSAVANGSFTINHTNPTSTGRTFLYAIGG
jgi:hypothetical protein